MIALDPLLEGGIGLAEFLIVVLKTVVVFGLLLGSVIMMIWFERKILGDLQNRIGPNKAGPWGMLQTLADGMKLILKEDNIPEKADRRVFVLAPFLSAVPAFVTFAVIPIAGAFDGDREGVVRLFGHDTYVQLADPPIGVLLILAMSSVAVYGVMLAGWSSGSKYPLLGIGAGRRPDGQLRGGPRPGHGDRGHAGRVAVDPRDRGDAGGQRLRPVRRHPVPPLERHRHRAGAVRDLLHRRHRRAQPAPLRPGGGRQELVGGYHTEYSSFRFALFYLAEFLNTITMSAIMVVLFFGGPAGPTFDVLPHWLWGLIWFSAKLLVFLFVQVWIRATLPRFRYDQLMNLGWKSLIPLSLGWVLLLGAINIGRDEDWNMAAVVGRVVRRAGGRLRGAGGRRLDRPAPPRVPLRRGDRLMVIV